MARRLRRDEYTVGWVCALPIELAAAQAMLDERHDDLPQNGHDANTYTLGRIGDHNVVLACLPAGQTGTNSAATVAMQMKSTFHTIRFGLMVGIGGGVPSEDVDIRLGDIVVSQPGNGHGGVIQYDFGKLTPRGIERTGFLNTPPQILLTALSKLRAKHDLGESDLSSHLMALDRAPKFRRNQAGEDVLFEAVYNHVVGNTCTLCDDTKQLRREPRTIDTPEVHYGTIASGNLVIRDGIMRDKISSEFGRVLCFEMEAVGLMNSFPCLVIRGICDYADSHKNKKWQPYAAGTAAAYAKELLLVMPPADVAKTQTADEATREQKRSFHLPFLRNRQFVGRSAELDTLKRKLLMDKDCQKMAISGLGGIGKTQMALQFAYSVKQDYPEFSIFWVPAVSMETFEQAYEEVARALGIRQSQGDTEDVKRLVQRRLSAETAGKWLLIVDNADDLDLLRGSKQTDGLLAFLPESDNGLTVFTTRHGGVAQYLAGSDVVGIGKMNQHETVNLLEKSLVRMTPPCNDEMVMNLLTELEYLPLAITQAAAYININKSSISEYLRLLKNTEQDAAAIMSTDFGDRTRYQNLTNAVARTWMITFSKILKHDSLAADILGFVSCIEWKDIPSSILPATDSQAQLAGAIGTLCSYSFLDRRDDGVKLDMHRLVHLATRIWIRQNGREAETSRAALKHLSEVFPSDDYTNRETWRQYLPHVARVDKDEQCQNTKEKSELCLKVGRCLYVDGRMKEAVLWLIESCKWRDKNLPEDDADRLLSRHALASAYQANGQVKEAVSLLEQVVAIRREVLAEDHDSRLASQHNLARAYRANGQVKEAVSLLEQVVAIQAEVFAEDHPSRLASQHELARAYQANGRVKEAVSLLEHVVAIQAKVLAEDHPDRLVSQTNLSAAYQANGQTNEAVKLLEYALTIYKKVFAESHPDRLAAQHTLASAYQANGKVKEAVSLLEQVVMIRRGVLAEDHPHRLASQHNLASAYQANGKVKESVSLLEQVMIIRGEALAEDHPHRLASQHNLASAYRANGQVKEAVSLLEQVVAIQAEVLAEDHPHRLASRHELAGAYQANGQVKEAVSLLEQVVAIRREVLAEDHPSRLASQHELAGAYQANGQIKEAVSLLEQVVAIQAEVLAEDHPSRLASQHELARAYQANRQAKEAVLLLEHVVTIQPRVLAEHHPDRIKAQSTLAGAYRANGQGIKAVELLEQVVAMQRTTMAENHPSRLKSERMLATFYEDLQESSRIQQALICPVPISEDEAGRQFNTAPEDLQPATSSNSACVTTSEHLLVGQELESRRTSKRVKLS